MKAWEIHIIFEDNSYLLNIVNAKSKEMALFKLGSAYNDLGPIKEIFIKKANKKEVNQCE